jgi:hypothetical protein
MKKYILNLLSPRLVLGRRTAAAAILPIFRKYVTRPLHARLPLCLLFADSSVCQFLVRLNWNLRQRGQKNNVGMSHS